MTEMNDSFEKTRNELRGGSGNPLWNRGGFETEGTGNGRVLITSPREELQDGVILRSLYTATKQDHEEQLRASVKCLLNFQRFRNFRRTLGSYEMKLRILEKQVLCMDEDFVLLMIPDLQTNCFSALFSTLRPDASM